MLSAARTIDTYDPAADLAERHPGWRVHPMAELPTDVGEVFLPARQLILVSREILDRDPDYAYAHLVAHLDLHPVGGPFSRAQEQEARMVAEIRLDRDDHCPMARADFH